MTLDKDAGDAEAAAAVWSAIKAQPLAMMTTDHEGELISRPMAAHPLFSQFVAAAVQRREEIARDARSADESAKAESAVN